MNGNPGERAGIIWGIGPIGSNYVTNPCEDSLGPSSPVTIGLTPNVGGCATGLRTLHLATAKGAEVSTWPNPRRKAAVRPEAPAIASEASETTSAVAVAVITPDRGPQNE